MKFDGQKLKKLRLKRNLTQNQLAENVGVSRNYINQIENGKKNPSIQLLEQIAVVFNCSIKSFF